MKSVSRKHGGKRKGAGRPVSTGTYPARATRWPPKLAEAVEKWAQKQEDRPSFGEAVRRLVMKALGLEK